MKSKKVTKAKALKKLRAFRERWAGHEGVETPYGHLLLGPKEDGPQKQLKKDDRKQSHQASDE